MVESRSLKDFSRAAATARADRRSFLWKIWRQERSMGEIHHPSKKGAIRTIRSVQSLSAAVHEWNDETARFVAGPRQ
jgi:hypothetical protein